MKINRNFLVFLFFVFVASLFWLVQTLNDTYETEVSVPVKITNVPQNALITSDIPSELKLTVRDKGTVLMNYILGTPIAPLNIDFLEHYNGRNNISIPISEFQKKISSQLSQSTKLLSIKPDTIDLIYTLGRAKKLPVQIKGDIKPAKQYYISNISYTPDSVRVYAPASILDTLKIAYTMPMYLQNIAENKYVEVDLGKIKGAKFIPSRVKVKLSVDIYAEKSLEVPVVGINFPAGKTLRTFPSKVKVNFQVGLRNIKTISAEDFFICVNYNDLINSNDDKCEVNLKSYPSFIKHVSLSPTEVDYLIEE